MAQLRFLVVRTPAPFPKKEKEREVKRERERGQKRERHTHTFPALIGYPEGHIDAIKKVPEGHELTEAEKGRAVQMEDGLYVCSDEVSTCHMLRVCLCVCGCVFCVCASVCACQPSFASHCPFLLIVQLAARCTFKRTP